MMSNLYSYLSGSKLLFKILLILLVFNLLFFAGLARESYAQTPLTANFNISPDPAIGPCPLTVTFTDTSTPFT